MADGERRMLFDIRGRRKHVVKVVYAILALMMGASLFLVVGPVNLGSLLSNTNETNPSTEIFDEQIERTEQRLRQDPNNPDILISLTRARINAGRARKRSRPDDRRTDRHRQGAGGVRKGQRRLGPVSEGRQGRAEPLPRLPRRGHHLPPRPELQDLRRSARIPRRGRRRPALRRAGQAQPRRLDDPGRLRVPVRRQSRRRRGGAQGEGARPDQVGKEGDRQTAGGLRKTVEGNPESQGGSRKSRKGQRQGSPRKPARRPRRRQRPRRRSLVRPRASA